MRTINEIENQFFCNTLLYEKTEKGVLRLESAINFRNSIHLNNQVCVIYKVTLNNVGVAYSTDLVEAVKKFNEYV